MRHFHRTTALLAMLALALLGGAGTADEGESDTPGMEPVSAPGEAGGETTAPPAEIPDQRAELIRYSVDKDETDQLVRITLFLSYPKHAGIHSRFAGQGSFEVTVPNTRPATRLPRRIAVAQEAVSDVVITVPEGQPDTLVTVRLNTPVRCRAYAVPSQKKVVIECAWPGGGGEGEGGERGRGERQYKDVITAEFVDTDIRVVIEALVAQTGANIILQPDVQGTYSLSLREVTLSQALDALWEAWGLVWMPLPGNIYLVGNEAGLGDREVDAGLDLPPGWTARDLARAIAARFTDLRLADDVEALPEGGPVAVQGPLRSTARARRWATSLPPREEGAPPPPTPRPNTTDKIELYPVHMTVEALETELRNQFRRLTITAEPDLGRVVVEGPRDEIARASALKRRLDVVTEQEAEEALWLPLIPPERIQALATASGVQIEVLYTDPNATLVYVRGKEAKIAGLRSLVTQLKDWSDRQRERDKAAAERGETVSSSYELKTLDPEHAAKLIAGAGLEVTSSIAEGKVLLTGRSDRVARLFELLAQADRPLVSEVYKVRYARTQDLVRLVRAAVPDLRLVDYQSHRAPGTPERIDERRLGPTATPVPPAVEDAATPKALGPLPTPTVEPAAPEVLGGAPQILLLGPQEAVTRAVELLRRTDSPPAEVELAALLAEVGPEARRLLGLTGGAAGQGFQFGNPMGLQFAEAVAAIEGDAGSKLLARPTLRTIDGGEASLLVGSRVGAADDGNRVGVSLVVQPMVPEDGWVLCRVRPEVSRVTGISSQGVAQVDTRETETTVRLRDGGVLVIGGLRQALEAPLPRGAVPTELVVLLWARIIPPSAPGTP